MRTYRFIYTRTKLTKSWEMDEKQRVEHQMLFQEKNDRKAIAYVLKWFKKKHTILSSLRPDGIHISYEFVRLEQVRDISKRCIRVLEKGGSV